MVSRVLLVIVCFFHIAISIAAINHWVLNENGKILQKIDTPFYLREPHNLIAFLEQIKNYDFVESEYLELLRQRTHMAEKIKLSNQFRLEITEQVKCALDYRMIQQLFTHTKLSKDYLKRINIKNAKKKPPTLPAMGVQMTEPFCWEYINLHVGICCYNHLDGLRGTHALQLDPEQELVNIDMDLLSKRFVQTLIDGLSDSPGSWKYHTLSSYYWRLRGDGRQAVECAKRGVMLAPRKVKDIALLSLGCILYRAGMVKDSEVVLQAAVDHAPEVAENHYALATTLAMNHKFNQSLTHLDMAEKLNPSFIPEVLPLRKFVSCFDNLARKIKQVHSYAEYIKNEVMGLKRMRNVIMHSHEKLILQQVPLGARFVDTKTSNKELLNRGQYCSTRTSGCSDEPVLFCDFYSDFQMKLEGNEIDIESMENELNTNSEAVIKQLSEAFEIDFDFKNPPPPSVMGWLKNS